MSLTDRDRKIVLAIVPLLLIAVYWFMVLSPKRKEATKLSAQVTKAEQTRDQAVSQANSLKQAKAEFAGQYSQMVSLGKAIPTQVDMPSLIVQLNAAAHGTGIQFGDIKVGSRVAAAPVGGASGTSSDGSTSSDSTSTGATGTTGATGATGTTGVPPVAAGGVQAQSTFGKAAESANNAAAKGDAEASKETALSAQQVTASASTPLVAAAPGQPVPGLDTVPLTFAFGGKFGNLANFFHRLKRFVHVANNHIRVDGRLITIDSLKFTSSAVNFPNIEADVTATVYLSPQDGGTTAGATSAGPAATTPGATTSSSTPATAALTPPTSAITR